jgi:hypothetical protein
MNKFSGIFLLIALLLIAFYVTLTLLVIKWDGMDRDIQALTGDCAIINQELDTQTERKVTSIKGVKQNE